MPCQQRHVSRGDAEGQRHHLESVPTPSASETTKPKLLLLGLGTDKGMFSQKNSGSFMSAGAGDSGGLQPGYCRHEDIGKLCKRDLGPSTPPLPAAL